MNKNEGIVSCSKSNKTNTDAAANPLLEKAVKLPRNCVGAWISAVFSDYYIYNAVWFFVNLWKSSARFSKQKCKRSLGSTLSNLKALCGVFQHIGFYPNLKKNIPTISSPVSKNFTDSHHKTIFTNDEMAITVFSTCNSVKNAVFCSFPWRLEWLVNHESLLSSK